MSASGPDLSRKLFKYRVMVDSEIIGTFSNRELAAETAWARRGAFVLDTSVQPHKLIYSERKWIGEQPQ